MPCVLSARVASVVLGLATTFLAACASSNHSDWVRAPRVAVHDQLVHSNMACGPTALVTAIASEEGAGADAVRALGDGAITATVERYGSRPSANDASVARFKPASGVNPSDLLAWTNEWRADLGLDARTGVFLDRRAGETEREHAARVHRAFADALAGGAVPMVRVRCFAPNWYATRSAYLWDGIASHWIAIVGVPRALEDGALGFPFAYADPAGGRLESGWAAAELEREFVAAKGDTEHWTWLADRPFLLVDAPRLDTLGRGGVAWFLRTTITLDHALLPPAVVADWPAEEPTTVDEAAIDEEEADAAATDDESGLDGSGREGSRPGDSADAAPPAVEG